MTIDILCKVVDNFGDIGVAWRLARALRELPEPPDVRLVVDELEAFAAIRPGLDSRSAYQFADGVEVVAWRGEPSGAVLESYRARPARAVVECFACGRPDWLEALLFAPDAPTSVIVDLEHLTAEPYARELHLMPSLTREPKVKKAMFLPGFDEGTAGLALDRSFARALERAASEPGRTELRREILASIAEAGGRAGAAAALDAVAPPDAPDRFWVPVFSYERDYGRIVTDLASFAAAAAGGPAGAAPAGSAAQTAAPAHAQAPAGSAAQVAAPADSAAQTAAPAAAPLALVAAGKSQACFMAAWEAAGRPFPAVALPFLPQETWDRILAAADFSIVRGEDSWARAALAGKPFLWQAYPQAERYQMVKVEAFLRRLQRHFRPADFGPIARAYRAFNDRDRDLPETSGDEALGPLLDSPGTIRAGFRGFAASLAARTDLAADLLTFFRKTV